MRKFLLALLCLMLAVCTMFSLVACGDNTGGNSGGDTPGVENPGNSDDPEKQVFVTGVNLPANIRDYLVNSGERENEEQQFFVLNAPYKVGDDNAFRFLPETTFEDELEIPVHVEEHEYTYVLEEKLELSYEPLAETCIERVDTIACEFDFSEEAIGKTVRLTVTPTGLTEEQIGDARYSVSFEFVVVDGYNIYDEIELGYFHYNADNSNHTGIIKNSNEAWTEFLVQNGYTRDPGTIKAFILQGNMNITAEDIPSVYLYSEEEINDSNIPAALRKYYYGTLKDANLTGIYTRRIAKDGESIAVCGNYYTIDISNMPVVLHMEGKTVEFDSNGMVVASRVTSQSQLFKVDGTLETSNERHVRFENFNLIGNAPKTNDKRAQGGLMFLKSENVTATVDNIISKRVFITVSHKRAGKVNVSNLKCYDSFSSPFHVFMARDGFYCDNVIAKNSGGPAIIVETASPETLDAAWDDEDVVLMSKVIATNCVFENWNDGSEAWYYMGLGDMAATAMPLVKSLNAIPQGIAQQVTAGYQQAGLDVTFNASFIKEEGQRQLFNVYCVVIDGKGGMAGAGQCAYVEINGNVMDYGRGADYYTNLPDHGNFNYPPTQDGYAYKKNDSYVGYSSVLMQTIQGAAFAMGAPVLETSAGGILYWDGANPQLVYDSTGTSMSYIQGDALNLYYSFSGAGLGTVGLMFEYMH